MIEDRVGRWIDRVMEDRETKRGWVALGDELGERERKKKEVKHRGGWKEGRQTDEDARQREEMILRILGIA